MTHLISILNGPNLNLLGTREPHLYGSDTLEDVERMCRDVLTSGTDLVLKQSNWEGQLVDWIHEARETSVAIVINPAGLGHKSVALLDALNMFDGPVIEVHVSSIFKREAFRHHTYTSQRADAVMAGFGARGYALAVTYLCDRLTKE